MPRRGTMGAMLHEERHDGFTRLVLARRSLGRPLYTVSVYVLGDTLIDSGPPVTAGELLAWCRDRGIRRVVHTHHHEDHVGGSALLARELGVEVLAPAATVGALHRPYAIPPYRRLVWGQPQPCPAARPLPSRLVAGERELVPLPTPGHSHDHVAYFVPATGWLLSGDLWVARRVVYLRRVENAWLHLASLERASALAPELLLCAHAGPVAGAQQALGERMAHWEQLATAARALQAEGLALGAIRRRLLGREGLMAWLSLGDFSKKNLVASLLFHRPAGSGGAIQPTAEPV
jgi:glyoxylase-like metal-dependent hydrolase (beta-lactamase superfamily II)